MLELEHNALGVTGAQVVTGTLSAFGCKGTLGELCSSLSGFVNLGKVNQSSVTKHIFEAIILELKYPLFTLDNILS